jgi:hypothetical protein
VIESPAATSVAVRNGATGPVVTVGGLADLRVLDVNASTVAIVPGQHPEVDMNPAGTIAVTSVSGGFNVYDLSDPANPVLVGGGTTPTAIDDVAFNAQAIAVVPSVISRAAGTATRTAYLAGAAGTVAAYEWETSTPPTLINGHTAPQFNPKGLTVTGETVMVADGWFPGKLTLLAAHAPAAATAAPPELPEPESLRLGPARPNPSRGPARLVLALAGPTELVVSVHDVAGRRVRELARGTLRGGSHVVTWDGRDHGGAPAAGGVYFVRLEAEGRVETRKVVMTR